MRTYFRAGLVCFGITAIGLAKWLWQNGKTTADLAPLVWSVIILTPILATVVVGTFGARAKAPWNWTRTILFSFVGWLATVAVFSIVMLGFGWHLRRDMDSRLDQAMGVYATEAVQRAKTEFGVSLDYSTDSLAELERVLEQLHQRNATNAFDQQALGRESQLWGAYIGGVFKKLTPAEWKRDSKAAGEDSFPLTFRNGSEFFPCGWVWKRLQNGKEDNVMFKFYVSIKSLNKGGESITNEPGVTVLHP